MTISSEHSARSIRRSNDRDRLLDAGIGLAEEAAELLGLIRKRVFQGRDIDPARLSEELGDVLWCLAISADTLGIRLSQVAEANRRSFAAGIPRASNHRLRGVLRTGRDPWRSDGGTRGRTVESRRWNGGTRA